MTTNWQPSHPVFDQVVRESFARQTHMATLGARISRLDPGAVDLTAPFDSRFTQQNGFWHAGAVASLADSANGYAAFSLAPPETDVLAVEFTINLLAPAQGDTFRAQAYFSAAFAVGYGGAFFHLMVHYVRGRERDDWS